MYEIYTLEVMIAFLDLENSQKPYPPIFTNKKDLFIDQ